MFLSLFCLGSYELTERNVPFLIFTLYIYLHHFNVHVRRRSTRRRTIASVATHYYSSTLLLAHSFMCYARSHGSAHASLSLDVSVAATPIPRPKPISPYITTSKFFLQILVHAAQYLSEICFSLSRERELNAPEWCTPLRYVVVRSARRRRERERSD